MSTLAGSHKKRQRIMNKGAGKSRLDPCFSQSALYGDRVKVPADPPASNHEIAAMSCALCVSLDAAIASAST